MVPPAPAVAAAPIGRTKGGAARPVLGHHAHWVLPEHVTQLPLKTFVKKS